MTANDEPLRDRIAANRQVFWEGDLRQRRKAAKAQRKEKKQPFAKHRLKEPQGENTDNNLSVSSGQSAGRRPVVRGLHKRRGVANFLNAAGRSGRYTSTQPAGSSNPQRLSGNEDRFPDLQVVGASPRFRTAGDRETERMSGPWYDFSLS